MIVADFRLPNKLLEMRWRRKETETFTTATEKDAISHMRSFLNDLTTEDYPLHTLIYICQANGISILVI